MGFFNVDFDFAQSVVMGFEEVLLTIFGFGFVIIRKILLDLRIILRHFFVLRMNCKQKTLLRHYLRQRISLYSRSHLMGRGHGNAI